MNFAEIWRNVLGELEVTLSKANFQTWFRATFIIDFKKGIFTIGVPSFFAQDWLQKKYLKEIQKALQNQTGEDVGGIKFKITAIPPEIKKQLEKIKVIHTPVDNLVPPTATVRPQQAQTLPTNNSLNTDYKFEDFIVGPSNQLAHAAALAVANNPGLQYNPLFIYGDSGLGKTHLIQAIGQEFLSKYPDKQALYISSETFINEFISAVEAGHGRAKDFKDRYRNVDLLLIDDIQFLSRKEGTQDEFFHTFNHLHQNKKQVVLTADKHPRAIKGLEVRLQTRFEGGMVTDISQPDLETREAILRHKAKKQNREIDNDVIRYVAENVQSSIRELEGTLTKIVASCDLQKIAVNIDSVKDILSGLIEERKQAITPDLIIREVHRYFKLPIEDILGPRRTRDLVIPRQITMYLLRYESNLSFPDIGRVMSGRDHSTIIHGCEKIGAIIAEDVKIKDDIGSIKERIYSLVR